MYPSEFYDIKFRDETVHSIGEPTGNEVFPKLLHHIVMQILVQCLIALTFFSQ